MRGSLGYYTSKLGVRWHRLGLKADPYLAGPPENKLVL